MSVCLSLQEYSPESFGSVHMLYVQAEVNKMPIKAVSLSVDGQVEGFWLTRLAQQFVDSGAQATISAYCTSSFRQSRLNSRVHSEPQVCSTVRVCCRVDILRFRPKLNRGSESCVYSTVALQVSLAVSEQPRFSVVCTRPTSSSATTCSSAVALPSWRCARPSPLPSKA